MTPYNAAIEAGLSVLEGWGALPPSCPLCGCYEQRLGSCTRCGLEHNRALLKDVPDGQTGGE